METLFISLTQLTFNWLIDVTVKPRKSSGCTVIFENVLPCNCLRKLIAFCVLHNKSYYLSAYGNYVEFQIS